MGFGGVPLKQHIVKNARKIVKTGAKNALDFFCQYTYMCRRCRFLLSRISEIISLKRLNLCPFGEHDL